MRKSGLLASVFALGAEAAAIVRGVNLGGWLVTEPWMTPSLFTSTNTADEWHLCNTLGKEQCLSTLQQHWSTFYTRDDLVAIQAAGLRLIDTFADHPGDAIRIPLGYWAVDLLDYEPYVSGQYPYLIQAVNWANELGLKVLIDIHGAPGSQNGWEESGLVGGVLFPTNTTNTNRTLNVLQNLTTEFTKDIYGGAVTNIELLNEPVFAFTDLTAFYTDGAAVVGPANSSGINVTIHDAFYDPHTWVNYDPTNPSASSPAPYITLDTHQFWAFPPLTDLTEPEILQQICALGAQIKALDSGIPPTLVGEWSLSTGITANSTTNTADDVAKRTWFRQLFEAQNAAFTPNAEGQASIGWYFWAWQTEYDIDAWSYRKGLSMGYIPSNISNASTLVYPILDTGCIDTTHNYTAPAIVSSTTSSTSTATATGTAKASSTAKGAASVVSPSQWSGLLAVASFVVFTFC